jgi:uncharacterized spore protein YtfJ
MNLATTAEEMVRRIGAIPDDLSASACFGTPVEKNGHTIIPVARVSFGYGMGFGGGTGSKGGEGFASETEGGEGGGGGGGGGGSATPVAIIDVGHDVTIQPVTDSTRISLAGMVFAGWAVFWTMLTFRTIAREMAKTRRLSLEKSGS